ncbi:CpsD/CapB family tyrosine-protein kinase [Enterococcus faecium]
MNNNILNKKLDESVTRELIAYQRKDYIVSEQYRAIRTNIEFIKSNAQSYSLVITSPEPGEGKTTTATNLAIVFADTGKKVLLIDGDLRRGRLKDIFNLPNKKGMSNLLSKNASLSECIQKKKSIENLSFITSGPYPPNPSELLHSVEMDRILQLLSKDFDLIIIDMPPVLLVADTQVISNKTDGIVLVVREGVTSKEAASKAKRLLLAVGANIIGAVYNDNSSIEESYYY